MFIIFLRFLLCSSKRKKHGNPDADSEPPIIEGETKDDGEYDRDGD